MLAALERFEMLRRALRKRKAFDDVEARQISRDKTAMLAHAAGDVPMVRVVAYYDLGECATQNPTCAKLVVWTPTQGAARTPQTKAKN